MRLRVMRRLALAEPPSASGLESCTDGLWVVGDDHPWLCRLDQDYRVRERLRLAPDPSPGETRIAKRQKPDLEALAAFERGAGTELLLLGSGSRAPQRDVVLHLDAGPSRALHERPADALYARLRTTLGVAAERLNLEAATVAAGRLWLFNRDDNRVLHCALDELLEHLEAGAAVPDFEHWQVRLPALEDREAGFSGAATLPGNRHALVTASVEHTDNSIDDGEVAGSFLGLLDLHARSALLESACAITDASGAPLRVKVESVAILASDTTRRHRLVLACDDDQGGSELLEAELELD